MTLVQCCCWCCHSLCLLFFFSKTFEAKIHHLETRPCRKLKDSLEGLEYFVRCEVHLSDVSTLVGSIKRNAEDVKTTKEVKCNTIFFFLLFLCSLAASAIFRCKKKNLHLKLMKPFVFFPTLVHWFPKKIVDLDKCHHLVTKFDPDLDQDHPVSNNFSSSVHDGKQLSWHWRSCCRATLSGHTKCNQRLTYLIWTGLHRPGLQTEEENDRRHRLQIQTVRQNLSSKCCTDILKTEDMPGYNDWLFLKCLLLLSGEPIPRVEYTEEEIGTW